MKFLYVGDYPEGRDSLEAYGCIFRPGEAAEVPAQFEKKALGNRFFHLTSEPNPEKTAPPQESGAAEALSKEDLIAKAEQFGVKIDRRWNVSRIADAIIAHANTKAPS